MEVASLRHQRWQKADTTTFYWHYKPHGNPQYGCTYAFSITGNATAADDGQSPVVVPAEFALEQNYPNPFNPATSISYILPRSAHVRIAVYNVLGEVASLFEGQQSAGKHSVIWNGAADNGDAVPSGIYFYRLSAGQFVDTRKMLLLK